MITYQTLTVKSPKFPRRTVSKWITIIAGQLGKRVGDISIIFCNDVKILEINKEYLNHNYYTDIITFDYSENNVISGDIFISIDTVRSNAEKYNEEYAKELYRVIIHGVLHLCGIDDKAEGAREIMEKNEDEALHILYETNMNRRSFSEA